MRIVRLFGVVLTILAAGLPLAAPAGAQPPSKLTEHITDNTGVLTGSDRTAVNAALDRLYQDQHVELWVVYVDNFSRFKPENWADKTRSASGMHEHDALLAVATNTKAYAFSVPAQIRIVTAADLNRLRSNKIEPAMGAKDWSGAAVAAADGLNQSAGLTKPSESNQPPGSNKPPSSSYRIWLMIAIGVIVVVVIVVVAIVLYRGRRRRAARPLAPGNVQRVDSLGQALTIADARLRQASDYVVKHHENIGAEARARFDEARRHLAARTTSKQATSPTRSLMLTGHRRWPLRHKRWRTPTCSRLAACRDVEDEKAFIPTRLLGCDRHQLVAGVP